MKRLFVIISILISCDSAMAAWGAIAYDNITGRWAGSRGWPSQYYAENDAIYGCGSFNCRVYIVGSGTYLAMATSNYEIGVAGFGRSWNRDEAMWIALNYCNQGAYSCSLRLAFSTDHY